MYFDYTTASERSIISAVLYSAVQELQDAADLLGEIIYDDLSSDNPNLESALPRLRLACNVVDDFISGFFLTIGDESEIGARNRCKRMDEARLAAEVNRAHAAIDELNIPKEHRRGFYDRLYEIMDMKDKDAITALDALKKEVRGNG